MKLTNEQINRLEDIEIEGVDMADYGDFCDAFVASATLDGRELTEEECDSITMDHGDWLNEKVFESIY